MLKCPQGSSSPQESARNITYRQLFHLPSIHLSETLKTCAGRARNGVLRVRNYKHVLAIDNLVPQKSTSGKLFYQRSCGAVEMKCHMVTHLQGFRSMSPYLYFPINKSESLDFKQEQLVIAYRCIVSSDLERTRSLRRRSVEFLADNTSDSLHAMIGLGRMAVDGKDSLFARA